MGSCITTRIHLPRHVLLFPLLFFPLLQMLSSTSCANIDDVSTVGCIDIERQALLKFKQGLTDPSGQLSSWHGEDCCKWIGVSCNNKTGNVVKIDFHYPSDIIDVAYVNSCLRGEISPSLLNLKHLRYLDLSNNCFEGINFPNFIGSLTQLRHLDLAHACFSGEIPPHLGNLSNLHYLNLNKFCPQNFTMYLVANSLQWLSGLPSLEYLYMKNVNLSKTSSDWLEHVNMLPALLELQLDGCGLQNLPSTLPFVNFTSLVFLGLSSNSFSSSLPQWLTNLNSLASVDFSDNALQGPLPHALGAMTSLNYVYFGGNHFEGKIPRSLGNHCNLKVLFLQFNNISGEITEFLDGLSQCPNKSLEEINLGGNQLTGLLPDSIGSFKNLKILRLHGNHISGTIPESIGKLSQLLVLDLSNNSLEGVMSESHFANLTKLERMDFFSPYEKSLVLNVSSNWIPPFRGLVYVDMTNCILGPLFPSWLQFLKNLSKLLLRNTQIIDTLPYWVWDLPLDSLDLSYNNISGRIPSEFSNVTLLLLTGNFFSGSIPSNIGRAMPKLALLDLSMNLLKGSIPSSICELSELICLKLSDNRLTGELPRWCWGKSKTLQYVNLANNKLTGKIPDSLIFMNPLKYLKLTNNKFYGKLPSSFQNQSGLKTLDLERSGLSGEIPTWIGNGFPDLRVLSLHSNHFTGKIPSELCSLSSLQLLDLGGNELSDTIPRCFGDLTAMAMVGNDENDDTGLVLLWGVGGYYDIVSTYVDLTIVKGRDLNYSSNLRLLKGIDLSNNNLFGDIPQELTKLVGLHILNLSMNHFKGMIPEKIGQLKQLECFDLSQNQLTGPIPPSITSSSFLSHLNLSYNNLRGKIPTGNQLQTLNDSSIYEGNPELCGPPLTNKCKEYETDEDPPVTPTGGEEDGMQAFYVSMAIGFIVGFWGVCGVLVLKRSWRHSYFQFIDGIKDRIYVFMAIKMAHMRGWRG